MFSRLLYLAPILWTRNAFTQRRRFLFDTILEACSRHVHESGVVMKQDQYYVPVSRSDAIIDAPNGELIFHVKAEFFDMDCSHTYSIWQLGDILKVGLLLKDGLEQAFLVDWHNEIKELWNGASMKQFDRTGTTLYEWTFNVPQLYDHWKHQEAYVLGMRHCHQRILRILHDYAKMCHEGIDFAPPQDFADFGDPASAFPDLQPPADLP